MAIKTYRVYLRITKNGIVKASRKPNYESLSNNVSSRYSNKKYFPTLQLALDLKIDENDFEATRILLEQQITNAKPAVEIKEEEKKQE